MLDDLRERLGLTRDEERHLEVLSLFRTAGYEGCDAVFLSDAEKTRRARVVASEFGWCTTCRKRPARPNRRICAECTKISADHQRNAGRAAHLEAQRKSNAKIRARCQRLGICVTCRKRPARPDRVDCQPCTDRAETRRLARQAELRQQLGAAP